MTMSTQPPAIQTADLSAGYFRQPVIRSISLSIPPGEMAAIIGPNGSGKTTLLRALAGALQPLSGSVRISGIPLHAWRRRDLARLLAVVPQASQPAFGYTVREFVALGRTPHLGPWRSPSPADFSAIDAALRDAQIAHLADKPVTELSAGQLQRAIIARALAQTPKILLLDEPTAFLDPAHQIAIMRLLASLNKRGVTILAVLHDLNLAACFFRRIIALRGGQIFADGPAEQVVDAALLSSLYETPVHIIRGPDGLPRVLLAAGGEGPPQ